MTGARHTRRAIVTLLAAGAGCGGEGWPCDPSAEGPAVAPVAYFGLFDTNGTRICPDPDGTTYSVGPEGVGHRTRHGLDPVELHARLTPDALSFDVLEGGPCNLTLGITGDAEGVFDFPSCPSAIDLHYTIEVPGCARQVGVFARDRFEHPAASEWEYRIPVFLDCDDTVARWPEGAPRPEL